VYYNYGLLLQRVNRPAEARHEYDLALKGYDDAVGTLESRGREWAVQLPSDSQLAFRRADVFRRNKAEVINALGTLAEGRGDLRGAQGYYLAARQQNHGLWPATYNLAKLKQHIAENADKRAVSSEAMAFLRECEQVTKDIQTRLLLAQLYVRRGNNDEAGRLWLAVHDQTPDNVEALTGLAQVERANKNFLAAIRWQNQAIATEVRKRQALAAQQALRKGRNQNSTDAMANPQLYADLAEIYRQAGDAENCRTAYESAVAAAKGSARVAHVRLLWKAGTCSNPVFPVR
jgi:tetratricopeptide (TPR) repeat protein